MKLLRVAKSLTVYALEAVTYTLAISTTVGGTTDPAPGAYVYTEGEIVPVTAIPETGYMLNHWELDGVDVGKETSINITMDSNHDLYAVFSFGVGDVQVTVLDVQTNQLISDALVKILKDRVLIGQVYTDQNGKASFTNISQGSYTVFVQATGYEILEQAIEVAAGIVNYFEARLSPVRFVIPWWLIPLGVATATFIIIIKEKR